MERQSRILTPSDAEYIETLCDILHTRLSEKSHMYRDRDAFLKKIEQYNLENVLKDINSENPQKRYVGCFDDNTPTGILIEEDKVDEGSDDKGSWHLDINLLSWLAARESGKGVGSFLVRDSLERARAMDKDYAALSVAERNVDAIRFYKRMGFVNAPNQLIPGLILMGYKLK